LCLTWWSFLSCSIGSAQLTKPSVSCPFRQPSASSHATYLPEIQAAGRWVASYPSSRDCMCQKSLQFWLIANIIHSSSVNFNWSHWGGRREG
jgi:hypothetical protein